MKCQYIVAGKTRGGKTLYYCTTHGYYTTSNQKPCPGETIDRLSKNLPETRIDLADYPGGIGVWGALHRIQDRLEESLATACPATHTHHLISIKYTWDFKDI